MKKFVKVYDNIIPSHLVDAIENLVLNSGKFPLYYSNNLTYSKNISKKIIPGMFHTLQLNDKIISPKYFSFFLQVLYGFCKKININIKEILASRIFVDLPTTNYGPDLPPHTDLNIPHFVCLYYINDSDGDTILFEDDGKTEIKRISPKKGRIVFFNGLIKHCGSRSKENTRAVLNIDFNGEFINTK